MHWEKRARQEPRPAPSPEGGPSIAQEVGASGPRRLHANREQFFAVASRLIRRVLVDHARERHAAKRAGGWQRVTLVEGLAGTEPRDVDLLDLDAALDELTALDPRRRGSWSFAASAG